MSASSWASSFGSRRSKPGTLESSDMGVQSLARDYFVRKGADLRRRRRSGLRHSTPFHHRIEASANVRQALCQHAEFRLRQRQHVEMLAAAHRRAARRLVEQQRAFAEPVAGPERRDQLIGAVVALEDFGLTFLDVVDAIAD